MRRATATRDTFLPPHSTELSSDITSRGPCLKCGSSDAYTIYTDGHAKCYSCQLFWPPDSAGKRQDGIKVSAKDSKLIEFNPVDLRERRVREDTCTKFKYGVGEYKGKPCQVATYCDDTGKRIAQKLRFADKTFTVLGDGRNMPFYGQWLWNGGKSITITEGEIDCLSMSQAFENKWPVVSLPNGAQSAASSVKAQLEYLDKFETVVLCFDMDKPGREAISAAASLLPVGRVKVMNLPEKDANATLVKRGPQALTDAYWKAKDWRPDGIIPGTDLTVEQLMEGAPPALPWPEMLPELQEMTLGIRPGELTLLTAGTGIGKSTFARELAYYLHTVHQKRIGNVFLEESNVKTGQAYVAIDNSIPLGRLRARPTLLTKDQWTASKAKAVDGMWFYNHFGSLESTNLLRKLRYFRTALNVDFIILDHISIVISGNESSGEGERRDIDMLMTRLRSLIEETGVGIIAIVHLKQPEGTPHEEGGRVTLSQLRGSGSLKQLTDNVVAFERNQQGDDPTMMLVRLLKNREVGDTGPADQIQYDRDTGRLKPKPVFEPITT